MEATTQPKWKLDWPSAETRPCMGVYACIHKATGKAYVGRAYNLITRRKFHIAQLRRDDHPNIHLQRAWEKFGEDAFEWKVLEETYIKKDLKALEKKWMDHFGAGDPARSFNLLQNNSAGVGDSNDEKEMEKRITENVLERIAAAFNAAARELRE